MGMFAYVKEKEHDIEHPSVFLQRSTIVFDTKAARRVKQST